MRISLTHLLPFICLTMWSYFEMTAGVAVMSVDLGTEWMKIAIVSPGVPMEIVLNKESKRKTPVAISFRGDDREFGENAASLNTRFPEKVYRYILEVIGKTIDNPAVSLFQKRFPQYKILNDKDRNTVVFQQEEGNVFTPEELLAMILEKARDLAQDFAGQLITDVVVTVPSFFNQAERRAVKEAAELAGLKVLQLMSDNAAVALNYGIFRRKDFNATMQRIMFFDMGAGSSVATIVGYQIVKTKEKGFAEDNPQLSILGVGYDRTLGGLEITLRLQNHFAQKFNEKKLTPNDVFLNSRGMAKLFKEAERVKIVLSANADHVAQVESLVDDKDFKLPMSRTEFETICDDLFKKIRPLIEKTLKSAELSMDDIDQVIIVGAGTRVPRVQEEILKATKKTELGKNLNTDEAAALGAVYQAAYLSQGFKVKRFIVKEAVLFPINVSFERELDPKEGAGVKQVSRTLFGPFNPFPQKKVMTFNRHVKDFSISVNYGELKHLSAQELEYFGSQSLLNISLSGVATALDKHANDQSEYKGVKAHFKMDESGILYLDQAESVFDKSVPSTEDKEEGESAFSRLGKTISKLFSGKQQGDDNDSLPEEVQKSSEQTAEEDTGSPTTPSPDSNNASSETKNDTTESKPQDLKNASKPVEDMKVVTVKEPISIVEVKLDIKAVDSQSLKSSRDKLKLFNDKERAKQELEEAHNSLESFILETREKLYESEYEAVTDDAEKETIQKKLNQASEWLYEESDGATIKDYKAKLSALKSVTNDMFDRVKEHRDRPEAIRTLKDILNASEYFLTQVQNATEDEQYFTEVEKESLGTLINNTQQWLQEKEKEQADTPLFKSPVITIRNIAEKIAALDREVKYMINKARVTKPKPKTTKNDGESDLNKTSSNSSEIPPEEIKTDEPSGDTKPSDEKIGETKAEAPTSADETTSSTTPAPQLHVDPAESKDHGGEL